MSASSRPHWPWARLGLLLIYLLALLGVALLWRDPMGRLMLSPPMLVGWGREVLQMAWGPAYVLGTYVLALVLGIPVLVLTPVCAFLFGTWIGVGYAWSGLLLGGALVYGLGRFAGAQMLDRWLGGRLFLLAQHLHNRGLWTVMVLRAVPALPFIVVSLGAGALRMPWRDYVLGTALGVLPSTVLLCVFTRQLLRFAHQPGWSTGLLLAGWGVLVAGAYGVLRRQLRRRRDTQS